jgi:hypothetical protein
MSPKEYDAFEQKALAGISIPLLMAFKPVTFERYAYPTHIAETPQVLRYADHNFEGEVPGLFRPGATFAPIGYVNSFTEDERDLFAGVRDRVASATLKDFGRPVRPITNLLVQMAPFRVMWHLSQQFGRKPLTLFEVGPGAAYIGALMASVGHRYLAYDVTQSLYLWQHYLLQCVAGAEFCETAVLDECRFPEAARAVHVPWWQYVGFLQRCPVRADVVYSNSNLGEMTPLALKHVLHISRSMLKGSSVGLFAYFSTGMTAQNSPEQIAAAFTAAGYRLVFDKPFMAYTPEENDGRQIAAAFAKGIPAYNPSGRATRLDANQVMPLKRSEAPLDAQLAEWNFGWKPPYVD